ncbi:MAG: TonB-dependent receptor, partial [Bacteroidota bacterium]
MKRPFILPFLLFCLLLAHSLTAQSPKGITVRGTVVESKSRQAVEFATVMLVDRQSKQSMGGTTTDESGSFELKARGRNFVIEISFIGFVSKTVEDFQIEKGQVNLGTILLEENSQTLDEVVVRGEKSTTEFKLDKRVFNVGKDLSSTGASALEVLDNVPSVAVNVEGQVSLRGSNGVQILINGKPSVIASEQGNALGTLTADMIEKIEVITNPSAKYDAEGTAGIINIVIKKEERRGFNGSMTINTGVPHNHSLGLSLNRRTEKFNLFSQLGVGYRELPRDNRTINRDLISGNTLESEGEEFRNETFYNFILGTDYYINKLNVLTLSGNFAYEVEDQPSSTFFRFTDGDGNLLSEWQRRETTEATNPKYQYELQYKKQFADDKEHSFLFSALGNFFGKDQSSVFDNQTLAGTSEQNDQQTRTNFKEAKYTFKADYTKPFSKKLTLESGAQYVLQNVSNDFSVSDWRNGEWIIDPNLTNIFEYDQNVLGVYSTGAFEDDKWGIKLGLRLEYTDLDTRLITTNENDNQNYTNLFPSAHASYKLSELFSLQAGYSRRIYRPRLWDLNPFFNIRNNFSIRVGNPELLPEFTDSYEVSAIMVQGRSSISMSVYHLYTTDVIERISTSENNVNTTRPVNIGTNRSTGVEFNGKFSLQKWLTLRGDINYFYFQRQGTLEATSFDFNNDRWTTRWTAKIKLPAEIDLEV